MKVVNDILTIMSDMRWLIANKMHSTKLASTNLAPNKCKMLLVFYHIKLSTMLNRSVFFQPR